MLIQNKRIFSKMLSYKFALSFVITIYTKQCHERLMIEACSTKIQICGEDINKNRIEFCK